MSRKMLKKLVEILMREVRRLENEIDERDERIAIMMESSGLLEDLPETDPWPEKEEAHVLPDDTDDGPEWPARLW